MSVLRICTDAVPPRERMARWREEFARSVLNIEFQPLGGEPFRADASICAWPGLRMVSYEGSALLWQRTRAMAAGGDGSFGMAFRRDGAATFSQRGRSIEMRPGDAVVISHADAGDLAYPSGRHLGLVIPLSSVAPLVGDVEAITPRHIPNENEALRLLKNYLRAVHDDLVLATPELRHLFTTHVHDLVAVAIGATRDGTAMALDRGVRAARLAAVRADILAHLGDCDLSVGAVAARQMVSPRYVQRLFEREGTSYSAFVLSARLAGAHRLLTDPRHTHRTITAIAFSVGFGDLSYFNRTFRVRYGATPSEIRKGALYTPTWPADRA